MRCREALNRLNRLYRLGETPDQDLLEHLKSCPACARQAEAARELGRAFAEGSVPDEVDRITWAEQICRVEAAVRTSRKQSREIPVMSALKRQFQLRPKLSASLAVTVVVLLAATLIPFKFDRTVGFEVAVAGVDRDLVLDPNRLQEFLDQHGFGNANVSVKGCDTVCSIVVTNLTTEDDARAVQMVFQHIGERHVITLNRITEEESGSVLSQALHEIFVVSLDKQTLSGKSDTVVARIGDDVSSSTFKWVGTDSNTVVQMVPVAEDESGQPMTSVVYIPEVALTEGAYALQEAVTDFASPRLEPRHWLNDTITDAARDEFAALGWTVELSEDKTTVSFMRMKETDKDPVLEADKKSVLPEGYFLSQNYPNPFNPTTQFDFSLPRTERVTVEVFNINGQKIRTLLDETLPAGTHTVTWDATSDSGDRVASGVYIYRLTTAGVSASKKMTLVK